RQRPQAWIPPNGLPVVKQHNRLPIRRHLNGAQRNAFGDHWLALILQRGPKQTNAHAVSTAVDSPGAVEGIEQTLPTELANLRTEHHVQWSVQFEIRNEFTRQFAHSRC